VGSLPATIQDAISITRALRIPFLWVDSLCIIQYSAQDKTLEIANMGNIYKGSYVTFSASRAENCNAGFLGIQEATRDRINLSATIPISCPDGRTGSVMLYPARYPSHFMKREEVPTDRRAWTYQEYLLSPRIVSFRHDAVEFICVAGLRSDDGADPEDLHVLDLFSGRQSRLDPLFYRRKNRFMNRVLGRALLTTGEREFLSHLWDRILLEYSCGRLTDQDDRLPALSAIASEFHRLWGGRYFAGLWDHQLVHDLQWRRFDPSGPLERPPRSRAQVYRAPSWSWGSISDTAILHLDTRFAKESSRVRVLKCEVDQVSDQARFSLVRGGCLTIRGPMKSMDVDDFWKCFQREVEFIKEAYRNEAVKIGRYWSDLRWEVPDDGAPRSQLGIPPGRGPLFFLGLSMRPTDRFETSGLVLLETGDGRYERVGLFEVGRDRISNVSTNAQLDAISRWGGDYQIQTISIC
jgi:hypothetical protein